MAEIIKEPIEEYAEPTLLDIARAKGEQRKAMQVRIDSLEKDTIAPMETRLAKVELTDTVKAELIAIKDPVIIKDPILTR